MSLPRILLLAGVASASITGAAFAAQPANAPQDVHVLSVPLGNGAIEQIRYTGDVAPSIVIGPSPVFAAPASFAPAAIAPASFAPTLAVLNQLSAAMALQNQAMLRQAEALFAAPTFTQPAFPGFGVAMPAFFAASGGNAGACVMAMRVVSTGGHEQVSVYRSPRCGAAPDTAPTSLHAAPRPPAAMPDSGNRLPPPPRLIATRFVAPAAPAAPMAN